MPRTKIICTLGPASSNRSILRAMIDAGMDVARLNFSHGSHSEHLSRITLVRKLNSDRRRHIRILQDLEGYRIRVGTFKHGQLVLKRRQRVVLTQGASPGEGNVIPFDYVGDCRDIPSGSSLYIDDGTILLTVRGRKKGMLEAEVVLPGVLKEHKGINIPGVRLPFKGLTDKDRKDLAFGIKHKVDFIAQSFVRDADDMRQVRRVVAAGLPGCKIIAKIENREGVRNIERIMKVCDGIMIARGDMGVSLPMYEVPVIQKEIIGKCRRQGKFVITATQMLETMTENPRPTRAEVSDVANAIFDGTGYVMLSGETAVGKYPARTVAMMNSIITFTEAHLSRKA
jgi:pyruvate kinase